MVAHQNRGVGERRRQVCGERVRVRTLDDLAGKTGARRWLKPRGDKAGDVYARMSGALEEHIEGLVRKPGRIEAGAPGPRHAFLLADSAKAVAILKGDAPVTARTRDACHQGRRAAAFTHYGLTLAESTLVGGAQEHHQHHEFSPGVGISRFTAQTAEQSSR